LDTAVDAAGLGGAVELSYSFRAFANSGGPTVTTRTAGDVDIDTGTATYKAGIVTAGTFESNIIAYTNNNIGRQAASQLCFVQQGFLPSGSKIEITFSDSQTITGFAAGDVTLTKGAYTHNMPGAASAMNANGGELTKSGATFTAGNPLVITTSADLGESSGLQVAFNFRTFATTELSVATKFDPGSGEVTVASGTSAYNSDITLTAGTFESNIIAYTNNAVGRSSAAQLCFVQRVRSLSPRAPTGTTCPGPFRR
jgi:uncharacterized membrane protein